jgi:hypothetical protein
MVMIQDAGDEDWRRSLRNTGHLSSFDHGCRWSAPNKFGGLLVIEDLVRVTPIDFEETTFFVQESSFQILPILTICRC